MLTTTIPIISSSLHVLISDAVAKCHSGTSHSQSDKHINQIRECYHRIKVTYSAIFEVHFMLKFLKLSNRTPHANISGCYGCHNWFHFTTSCNTIKCN